MLYTLRIKGTNEYLGGVQDGKAKFYPAYSADLSLTQDLDGIKDCKKICDELGLDVEIVFWQLSFDKKISIDDVKVWSGDN